MSRYFLTNLAGLNFRPALAKEVVQQLRVGDKLTLKREPDNAWDSNAIMIFSGEDFIGYVEALANPPIAPLMDGGTTFEVKVSQVYSRTEDKGDKRWMRPLIRIDVVGEEKVGELPDLEPRFE